ncbi:ATP synthase F1 subunit delta [Lichenicola sp.]|uniref:ATP synthase F1 subunit delta n=1 Tax=Lichenicola sp. TaxID=2804529 RepID=UPI003AFFC8E5
MTSDGTTTSPIARRPSGAAGRYATALYDLADERHDLDAVVDQADALGRLIDGSAELRSLLANPVLDVAQGRNAILAVMVAQGFGEILQHFVGVVANNRRLSDLRGIVAAFAALVASRRGIISAEVSSASPLTDLQRIQLRARLTEAGYGRVDIRERVDAALLGGLVVRVGPRLYDASLQSRLARLHYAMKGAA